MSETWCCHENTPTPEKLQKRRDRMAAPLHAGKLSIVQPAPPPVLAGSGLNADRIVAPR
jgi:hypothetical protein